MMTEPTARVCLKYEDGERVWYICEDHDEKPEKEVKVLCNEFPGVPCRHPK